MNGVDPSVPRRVRAARALAGLSVKDLAIGLDEPGLGERTLGKIEAGERVAQRSELQRIADVCGLPYGFFTVDLSAALGGEPGEEPTNDDLLRELRGNRELLETLMGIYRTETDNVVRRSTAEVGARLSRLEAIALRLEQLLSPPVRERATETLAGVEAYLRARRQEAEDAASGPGQAQGGQGN